MAIKGTAPFEEKTNSRAGRRCCQCGRNIRSGARYILANGQCYCIECWDLRSEKEMTL
jgi:hypothetical protein